MCCCSSMIHYRDCPSLCPICLICASDSFSHLSCKLKALKKLDGPLSLSLMGFQFIVTMSFSAQTLMLTHLIFCLLPFTKWWNSPNWKMSLPLTVPLLSLFPFLWPPRGETWRSCCVERGAWCLPWRSSSCMGSNQTAFSRETCLCGTLWVSAVRFKWFKETFYFTRMSALYLHLVVVNMKLTYQITCNKAWLMCFSSPLSSLLVFYNPVIICCERNNNQWPLNLLHREDCGIRGDSWSDGWPARFNADKGSALRHNVPLCQRNQRFTAKHWQRGQVPVVCLPGNPVSDSDF